MKAIYVFVALFLPVIVILWTRNVLLSIICACPYVMTIVLRYKEYRIKKKEPKHE